MDDKTAYLIMVLSPLVFLLLFLSVRYTVVYGILRKQHSRTFIEKQKGQGLTWLLLSNFKQDMGSVWFGFHGFTLLAMALSICLAVGYLLLWIGKYPLKSYLLPHIMATADILAYLIFAIKAIGNKIHGRG